MSEIAAMPPEKADRPPVVTIAMPIYNAGSYLRPAVVSILQQTLVDWELIIIDDGSSDGAAEGIRDICDSRIRVLRDGSNKGLAARLNEAIDLARGRYFARMDQDDISYPERLARQLAMLEQDPELDLVAVRCVAIDADNQLVGALPYALTHEDICARPWRGFYLAHPTWMGRTEWFRRYRYASPGPYFCEDQELLLRSYRGSRFAAVPEILFAYRVRTRINWRKSVKTRKTLLGIQLRYFIGMGQFHFGLLAAMAFIARVAMDSLNALAQNFGFPGFHPYHGVALDANEQSRWQAIRETVAVPPRRRLCYVVSSEMTVAAFLREHIAAATREYDVSVAVNTDDRECLARLGLAATLLPVPIERRISPWRDLRALWVLFRLFRRYRFDLVHSVSPKAGLLAMLAAWLARVPRRVHGFTGQVWVTRRGWRRFLLKQADRLLAALTTQALVDSPSQRDFLVSEGVLPAAKAEVIGKGSICGVDASRFRPDAQARREVREELGIAAGAPLLLFLGRMNCDKGVLDLAAAFARLALRFPDACLVLVGPDEEGLAPQIADICAAVADRVRRVDFTRQPERFMAAADIFCLPSYREGFGQVVIEAAAAGLPTVASRIYGITDAVVEGETGLLHPAGDVSGIEAALVQLIGDPARRAAMGEQARRRALTEFSQTESTRGLMGFYEKTRPMARPPGEKAGMSGSLAADAPAAIQAKLPSPLAIWVLAFVYAGFMALLLQKLILPIMPNLHASHGLMNQDAIVFHDIAVAMAQRIQAGGWSQWHLFPANGITGNVGLLAALYALLGPDPAWFIPFNAAFHALGALMIFMIGSALSPGVAGRIGGIIAALMFLAFPSSLVWYGQNHKDAFLIAGCLIALFAFLRVLEQRGLKNLVAHALLMIVGLALVATMRPYMLLVYAAAFTCAWLGVIGLAVFRRSAEDMSSARRVVVLIVISFAAAWLVPSGHSAASIASGTGGIQLKTWRWEKSETLPASVDHVFDTVSTVRAHVIESGRAIGAMSIVDGDIAPHNAVEMLDYLPRALVVGLFSPFPDTWAERPTMPRVIGAMETLLWYLLVPGALLLIVLRPNRQLVASLIFAAVVLTVLSYTSPNVGTLHRVRYGQLFLFILAGAIGWVNLFAGFIRSSTSAQKTALQSGCAEPASGAIPLPSRRAALGASSTVLLITTVGYLGLLARDLLLMNTYGFGVKLDSLYAALLLPMFFVSVFSLPLGDALIAGVQQRTVTHEDRLSLIRAAMSFTLLLSGATCLLLFGFADNILDTVLATGGGADSAPLLRLALLLLLFSGLVVAGNSILNFLNRPALVAGAQLLVPLFAIAAILVADSGQALYATVAGMIFGQLANLAVVFFFAYRQDYLLLPGPIKGSSTFQGLARNYGWLVLGALVVNMANPINYWFAGKLAVGSLSAWAMGSKLVLLVSGLTAAIMASVMMPYLAKLVSGDEKHRLRMDVYLMLVAGTWAAILASLIVFGFSEPFVIAAFSGGAVDHRQALQLARILKLGALQIPFIFSTLLLFKLVAVSQDSSKVVISTLVGLAINVVLNYALIPGYGVVGMAAAWAVSAAASAVVLLLMTRSHSGLGYGEVLAVMASWGVLGGFAIALHLQSLAAASTSILFFLTLWAQWRVHNRNIDVSTHIPGFDN